MVKMTNGIFTWRYSFYEFCLRLIIGVSLLFIANNLLQGQAFAQARALVPPQTVADVEFTVRAASLQMISPGAAMGALPSARFSIAITNRNELSIGLIVDPGPSGASTDTGLDLKSYNNNIALGLRACYPCKNIPDSEWVVLQPNQTTNVVVIFRAPRSEPNRHRKAEAVDLTLVLLVKEGSGGTTQAVSSWADIPIRNELQ